MLSWTASAVKRDEDDLKPGDPWWSSKRRGIYIGFLNEGCSGMWGQKERTPGQGTPRRPLPEWPTRPRLSKSPLPCPAPRSCWNVRHFPFPDALPTPSSIPLLLSSSDSRLLCEWTDVHSVIIILSQSLPLPIQCEHLLQSKRVSRTRELFQIKHIYNFTDNNLLAINFKYAILFTTFQPPVKLRQSHELSFKQILT